MSSNLTDLESLRRRLDEIDARLQDLLIDRTEIVSLVAASKKGGNQPAFQPAREAEIIRRLVRRHRGSFPVASLIRMWREMLAATVRLQSSFSVGVYAPADQPGFWDLARDHYGSHTPLEVYPSASAVIRAVSDRENTLGVLPIPREGEPDPWWPHLGSAADDAPRVIARLPFGSRGNARTNGAEALTIGFGVQQKSGLDRTLLLVECAKEISRARLLKLLSIGGLVCTFFAPREADRAVNLVEVEGFVPITDPSLEPLREELGGALKGLSLMGGYAVPLGAAALASRD
jgi:chorismate mutase